MSFITPEAQQRIDKIKFERKQENISKGKAKKENKKDWRLGTFCKECR